MYPPWKDYPRNYFGKTQRNLRKGKKWDKRKMDCYR